MKDKHEYPLMNQFINQGLMKERKEDDKLQKAKLMYKFMGAPRELKPIIEANKFDYD